jgi:hypothetical protein
MAGILYVFLMSFERAKRMVIPMRETDFVLFVLVGAVMIGIGAVLGRLDSLKERGVVAKPEIAVLTERHEPQLLSAHD